MTAYHVSCSIIFAIDQQFGMLQTLLNQSLQLNQNSCKKIVASVVCHANFISYTERRCMQFN